MTDDDLPRLDAVGGLPPYWDRCEHHRDLGAAEWAVTAVPDSRAWGQQAVRLSVPDATALARLATLLDGCTPSPVPEQWLRSRG
jgi:hypothetical protein